MLSPVRRCRHSARRAGPLRFVGRPNECLPTARHTAPRHRRGRVTDSGTMREAKDTTLRYLKLLACLPRHLDLIGTNALQAKLERDNPEYSVSLGTMQQDLERLSSIFPISCIERGRAKYWFWTRTEATDEEIWHADNIRRVAKLLRHEVRPLRLVPQHVRVAKPGRGSHHHVDVRGHHPPGSCPARSRGSCSSRHRRRHARAS